MTDRMPTICLSCNEAIPTAEYVEHRRACQDDIVESNAQSVIARYLVTAPEQGDYEWPDHCYGLAGSILTALEAAGLSVHAAAGSPPPTPALTREQVREAIMSALRNKPLGPWAMEARSQAAAAVVMALWSAEPAPPLWSGETNPRGEAGVSSLPSRVVLPVPPGTAVEVRPASPSAVTPPTDPRPALYDALTRIVGDIGPINDESSRRTAAHMLRHYGAEVREKRP